MTDRPVTSKNLNPFEQCVMESYVLFKAVRNEMQVLEQHGVSGNNLAAQVRVNVFNPSNLQQLKQQTDFLIALTDVNDVIQTLNMRTPMEGKEVLTKCLADMPEGPKRIAALKQINQSPAR